MDIFDITNPRTGKTVSVQGNKPPTQQEALEIFQKIDSGFNLQSDKIQKPTPGIIKAMPSIGQVAGGIGGFALGGQPGSAVGGTIGRGIGELQRGKAEEFYRKPSLKSGLNLAFGTPVSNYATLSPDARQRFNQGMVETAVSEAIGAVIAKGGGKLFDLTRAFGGVSKASALEGKRLVNKYGTKVLTDPARRNPAFFTDKIVPRVQQGLNDMMSKVTNNSSTFLKKIGITPKSIFTLKKKGYAHLQNTIKRIGDNVGVIAERTKFGLKAGLNEAGKEFDVVMGKGKDALFKPVNLYYNMKNKLMEIGAVDANGQRLAGKFGVGTIDKLVDVFSDLHNAITTNGKITGTINKQLYNRYLLRIQGAESSIEPANRLVFSFAHSLRKDATKAFPGLKGAMSKYSTAKGAVDEYSNKVTQGLFERSGRWDLATRKSMQQLDDILPSQYKFMNNLNDLNAALDIDKNLGKSFGIDPTTGKIGDPVKIEKYLSKMSGYESPKGAEIAQTRNLFSHFADQRLLDDATSHYIAKDLYQEKLSPGIAFVPGLSRKLTENITRHGILRNQAYANPYLLKAKVLASRGVPVGLSNLSFPQQSDSNQ